MLGAIAACVHFPLTPSLEPRPARRADPDAPRPRPLAAPTTTPGRAASRAPSSAATRSRRAAASSRSASRRARRRGTPARAPSAGSAAASGATTGSRRARRATSATASRSQGTTTRRSSATRSTKSTLAGSTRRRASRACRRCSPWSTTRRARRATRCRAALSTPTMCWQSGASSLSLSSLPFPRASSPSFRLARSGSRSSALLFAVSVPARSSQLRRLEPCSGSRSRRVVVLARRPRRRGLSTSPIVLLSRSLSPWHSSVSL